MSSIRPSPSLISFSGRIWMHEIKEKKVTAAAKVGADENHASEWTGKEVPLPAGLKHELAICRFEDGLGQLPERLREIGIEDSGTGIIESISDRISRLDDAPLEYKKAAAPLIDCLEKLRGILVDFGGETEGSFDRIELVERLQWLEQEISLFFGRRSSRSVAATNHLEESCAEFRDLFAEDELGRPQSWLKRWDPKGKLLERGRNNSLFRKLATLIENLRQRAEHGKALEENDEPWKKCLSKEFGQSQFLTGLQISFARVLQWHFRQEENLPTGPFVAGTRVDIIGPIKEYEGAEQTVELLQLMDRLTHVAEHIGRRLRRENDFWKVVDDVLQDIDDSFEAIAATWLPESIIYNRQPGESIIRICEYNNSLELYGGFVLDKIERIARKLTIDPERKEPQEGFGHSFDYDELVHLFHRRGAGLFPVVIDGEFVGFYMLHTQRDALPRELQETFDLIDKAGLAKRSNAALSKVAGITFGGRRKCRRAGLSAYDILHEAVIETARSLGIDQLFGEVREGVQANTAKRRHLALGWKETGIRIQRGSAAHQIMRYDIYGS